MALSQLVSDAIETYLIQVLESKLENYAPEPRSQPFLNSLLGTERIANASFVHSISTTLGMSLYEQIGELIANDQDHVEFVARQYKLSGRISSNTVLIIDEIVEDLHQRRRSPERQRETQEVFDSVDLLNLGDERTETVDLFMKTTDGKEYCFDLKTTKPNLSGSKENKARILRWLALRKSQDNRGTRPNLLPDEITTAIAMPYNPYAPEPYDRWTTRAFYENGEDLLVGEQFWDFLGGEGTYGELLEVFEIAGLKMFDQIEHRMTQIVSHSNSRPN